MWAEPTTTRHLFGSLSTDRLSEIFAKLSGPSGKNPKSITLKNLRKSSAGVVKVGARFRSSKEIAMASKFEPIPDSNGREFLEAINSRLKELFGHVEALETANAALRRDIFELKQARPRPQIQR
jgi:hypothetical protein